MFVAALLVSFYFAEDITAVLAHPLVAAWEQHRQTLGAPSLHFSGLIEPFWTYMNLAFWIGLIITSPLILYQLWTAITRARARDRRSLALPFSMATAVFFAAGMCFGYFFVLPVAFKFFLGYADNNLADMTTALGVHVRLGAGIALHPALFLDPYLTFIIRALIAFGLVFQLPIVIYFLASIGLVTPRAMWRFNRWATVIIFIVAAVLTPGPDVVSQVLMALPLLILYNLSIAVAWLVSRRRRRDVATPPAP